MCATRTMVSRILADLGRDNLPGILYPDACTLLVHHPEPLAHQRHVRCRFFAYARQRAREEAPVRLSQILKRTLPPLPLHMRTGRRPHHTAAPLPRSSGRCTEDRRFRPGRWSSTRLRAKVPLRLRTPRAPSRSRSWSPLRSTRPTRPPSGESRPSLLPSTPLRAPANPTGASPGSFANTPRSGYRPLAALGRRPVCETPTRASPSSCRARRVCARRLRRCGGSGWAV